MFILSNLNIILNWKKEPIKTYRIFPDKLFEIDNPKVLEYLKENYRNNIILIEDEDFIMTNKMIEQTI